MREKQPKLAIVPITFAEAKENINKHHRHHKPSISAKFSVAVADEANEIRGVAMVGRPIARMLDSCLYGAAWRAARALGYRRVVTYTLPEEGGTSLKASGYDLVGQAGGGSWSRKDRPRVDLHPTQVKLKWEKRV